MRTIFRSLLRSALPLALLVAAAVSLAGCAGPAPGFVLALQMRDMRLAAIDYVNVVFTPLGTGMMPRFTAPEVTSFEGGQIQLSVDDDGNLVMRVSGEYLRANAVLMGDPDLDPRVEVELWSDDTTSRMMAPQVRGVVVGGGFEIGTGAAFLPSWPVPLGSTLTLTLSCTTGREMNCNPP